MIGSFVAAMVDGARGRSCIDATSVSDGIAVSPDLRSVRA
jgi:hypothetical protein